LTSEYLQEFLKKFEMTPMFFSGAWGKMIQTCSKKSCDTVPITFIKKVFLAPNPPPPFITFITSLLVILLSFLHLYPAMPAEGGGGWSKIRDNKKKLSFNYIPFTSLTFVHALFVTHPFGKYETC
jgi:hypothetical protein